MYFERDPYDWHAMDFGENVSDFATEFFWRLKGQGCSLFCAKRRRDAPGNVLCRCGYEWVGGGVEEEDMVMRGKLYGVV